MENLFVSITMTTISDMFAEQEEDMARLNEIYQRVNERHEKMRSLMMMKEKSDDDVVCRGQPFWGHGFSVNVRGERCP